MPKNPYKKPANVGDYIAAPAPSAPRFIPPFIPVQGGVRPGGAPGPSAWQTESDNLTQWIRPGVSQVRFPALPVKANPQGNAAASSVASRIVASVASQTAANTTAIQNLANQSIFLGNWSPSVTYAVNNQVLYNGGYYISLVSPNFNLQPDTHNGSWQLITNQNSSVYEGPYSSGTTYQSGETVSFQGGFWVALNTTTGNAPSISSSHWTLLGASSVLTGAWAGGFSYLQNMQVSYNGNIFVALQANVGQTPPTPPATSAYWALIGPSDLDFIADGTVYIKGIGTVASESLTVANNNFEASSSLPVPGWLAQNGATLSYLTSGQQSGNQSLAVKTPASANGNVLSTTKYACQPGDVIYVGGFGKSDGNGVTYIGVRPCDASGSILALDVIAFGTSTSWTQQFQSFTMPANSVFFQIILLNGSAVNNSISYFDNIQCWRVLNLGTTVAEGPTQFFQSSGSLTYRPTSNPLSASDAGGSATVSVAAFNLATTRGTISYNSGSITGLSYSSLYYIYFSDSSVSGGSPTYLATTTKTTAIGTGDIFIGSIMTPASGAPNTVGNNDGGVGQSYGSTAIFLFGTSTSSGVSGQGSVTGINNAIDGNLTTFATLAISNAGSAASGGALTLSAASPTSAPWSSLTLNVRSAVPTNTVTPGSAVALLEYSLDGGNSFTTIYSQAASTTRALQTDSIALPINQNLALIRVQASVSRNNGTRQTVTQTVYEAWVTGVL